LNAPATIKNQISGYCYDLAGNLLGTNACTATPYTPTYTYDAENRLRGISTTTYTYDGDGSRVKKSNGSTGTLYWAGGMAESDLTAVSTTWKEYVLFGSKRIARRDASNSTVHYFFSDHLGSTAVITSSTGTIEQDMDYSPYGGVVFGSSADHYLFNGKEYDSETLFYNFGARYYSGAQGRFLTPDWAAKPTTVPYAVFGDPQSLNLYSFVENNPINRADADGHQQGVGCSNGYQGGRCVPLDRGDTACQTSSCGTQTWTGAGTYSDQNTAGVVSTTETDTQKFNADGSLNSTTATIQTTEATFSTAKGHEGQFLGATTETKTITTAVTYDFSFSNNSTMTTTGVKSITYGQAVAAIGANNMAAGVAAALPSFVRQLGHQTWGSMKQHPWGYVGASLQIAGGVISLGYGSKSTGAQLISGGFATAGAAAIVKEAYDETVHPSPSTY
jgi:RHS repeat-associated protein